MVEGVIHNGCNSTGNCNADQVRTIVECGFTDGCNAVREGDGGQVFATPKGRVVDGRNTVGDINTTQTTAIVEGTLTDGCDAVWNRDIGQTIAIFKG